MTTESTAAKVKLVIAESNYEEQKKLEEYFCGNEVFELAGVADDGETAVELTAEHKPEVVLCNFALKNTDGITLTERVKNACGSTRVVMFAGAFSDWCVKRMVDSGVDYYLLRPFELESLKKQILYMTADTVPAGLPVNSEIGTAQCTRRRRAVTDAGTAINENVRAYEPEINTGIDIYETGGSVEGAANATLNALIDNNEPAADTQTNETDGGETPVTNAAKVLQGLLDSKNAAKIDERISNIFIMVGIPAHIKGYQFLREAVRLAIENPSIVNSITKQLYPSIAKRFSTSASKVERAIRHAIEVGWNRGKIENINDIFGIKIYGNKDKPTNGEFIALVADKMLLEIAG